ncbi:MAG: glycosyltransferase [Lachnospiraceae bacterium]|nr:glycosyltransferase [Lachnospiraceae bacterium]
MEKVLSVAVPCYNSQDYVRRAVNSLLQGKDRIEIIIVNDGSTDGTAAIAEQYVKEYPDTVRLISKPNGGHGDAVMTGLAAASAPYFRVLDSDDWLDRDSLLKLLDVLEGMKDPEKAADIVITNYVYEKVNEGKSHPVNYRKTLPADRIFGWDEVGKFAIGSYILMHSATFRTELARSCGMKLPKHTFYVDHLYVCYPMTRVEKMYYLDTDLYRYFIGREDQSVNEKVMLSRMDQQIKVNRLLLYELDTAGISNKAQKEYLFYYIEIVTLATVSFLLRLGTKEDEEKVQAFLDEIQENRPDFYEWITTGPFTRHPMGTLRTLPKGVVYPIYRFCYKAARRLVCFN